MICLTCSKTKQKYYTRLIAHIDIAQLSIIIFDIILSFKFDLDTDNIHYTWLHTIFYYSIDAIRLNTYFLERTKILNK